LWCAINASLRAKKYSNLFVFTGCIMRGHIAFWMMQQLIISC
jgi:hypothetical protein